MDPAAKLISEYMQHFHNFRSTLNELLKTIQLRSKFRIWRILYEALT